MKKTISYVDAAKFETIIKEVGLEFTPQAGFVKVHGPKGRQVYVARTKNVGRVDISGFEMEGSGWVPFPEHGGSVKQQMDFGLPEAEILANFEILLRHMKTLQPVEKAKKTASSPTPRPKATGWSGKVGGDSSPGSKESRKELIERVAREMNVPVSRKTEEELSAPSSPEAQ